MPDKAAQTAPATPPKKEKARQASLLDAPEEKIDGIDKLVAQAFDADPQVRLKVAVSLARIDDPRAIFALIELSSDKEEQVKEAAQRALGSFKEEQAEIVSLEKILAERKAPQPQAAAPAQPEARANMMPTIEKLFAHYEPKKRESVKRKLLPSLQKLFGFKPEELDPLRGIDKISPQVSSAPVQVVVREEKKEEIPRENAPNFPFGRKEDKQVQRVELSEEAEKSDLVPIGEESEVVSAGEEEEEVHEAEEYALRHQRLFELAYNLATTPGMGKSELKREQNRMITGFKKEVESAFRLAQMRAHEEGLSTLTGLKPGMKNLSFSEMQISAISEVAYGARRKPYARIMLFDGKKEIALLVPKERAAGISVTDKLSPKKVAVDFIVEKNEVVLLATGKSQLVVVK